MTRGRGEIGWWFRISFSSSQNRVIFSFCFLNLCEAWLSKLIDFFFLFFLSATLKTFEDTDLIEVNAFLHCLKKSRRWNQTKKVRPFGAISPLPCCRNNKWCSRKGGEWKWGGRAKWKARGGASERKRGGAKWKAGGGVAGTNSPPPPFLAILVTSLKWAKKKNR